METTFDIQAPHEEASALIRGKPVVASEVFSGLLPELRGRAFTITGVEGANVMQRTRDAIAGVAEGDTWDDAKKQITAELDPWLGDGAETRAELLLRTHAFQAFQAANWRVAQEDEDTTHLQYLTMEDENVRDSHAALDGVVLPKDDPFWQKHYPPWEWGCRCMCRPMNPDMVADERANDETRNPEDHLVIEGPELTQLRNGTLMSDGQRHDVTPPSDGPDGSNAFQWHPDNLRLPVKELQARYDAPVWDEFKGWAENNEVAEGKTVWDWMNERQRDYKPAATPPGFQRTRDLATLQAAAKKVGIAEIGPAENQLEARFGRPIAKAKMVSHANDVVSVLHELKQRFPGLPENAVKKLLLVQPPGRVLGQATLADSLVPSRMAIRSRKFHEDRKSAWDHANELRQAMGHPPFTVDATFEGTVRHELGHTLTKRSDVAALEKTNFGPAWARKHLSEYAGTNPQETLAEAFCQFTAPGYQAGTLPPLLEDIVRAMVTKV